MSGVLKNIIRASHQSVNNGRASETILNGSTTATEIFESPSTIIISASSLVKVLLLCHGALAMKIGSNGQTGVIQIVLPNNEGYKLQIQNIYFVRQLSL
jgi:hypothetical protein